MELRWKIGLNVICVIEPPTVDPSDRFKESENRALPDEAGPLGGGNPVVAPSLRESTSMPIGSSFDSGTIMADIEHEILKFVSMP